MARMTLFWLALIMWLALTWPFSFADGFVIDIQSIVVGALASLATAFMFSEFTESPHKVWHPMRYVWFAFFMPMFAWECIKANFYVAYLVLHPSMPIHPGIVKVRTRLTSASGLTMLANCITLTPGTLTVGVTDEGHLYVHWIDVRARDVQHATEMIVARFEKYLTHIFD